MNSSSASQALSSQYQMMLKVPMPRSYQHAEMTSPLLPVQQFQTLDSHYVAMVYTEVVRI